MNETVTPAKKRRFPVAKSDGEIARVLLAFLATAGIFYVNIMPAIVDGLIEGLGSATVKPVSSARPILTARLSVLSPLCSSSKHLSGARQHTRC